MKNNTLEKLFLSLSNAKYNPSYDEESENILVAADGYDWEICESAAMEYFGVKREDGFSEPEYYSCNGIEEVLNLFQ